MTGDFVDELIASWTAARPEFDVAPVAVTTRLARVRDHLEGEMAAALGAFGLTSQSFVTLATLTRLGGAATEAQIAAEFAMTERTIAMRVDRLAESGLVARGEGGAVELTPRGRELAEAAVPAHLAAQARLLSALSADDREHLGDLLRKLLASLE